MLASDWKCVAYVDDIYMQLGRFGNRTQAEFQELSNEVNSFIHKNLFPLNSSKITKISKGFPMIGRIFNTGNLTSMPSSEKLIRLKTDVFKILTTSKASIKDLEQLLGRLNFLLPESVHYIWTARVIESEKENQLRDLHVKQSHKLKPHLLNKKFEIHDHLIKNLLDLVMESTFVSSAQSQLGKADEHEAVIAQNPLNLLDLEAHGTAAIVTDASTNAIGGFMVTRTAEQIQILHENATELTPRQQRLSSTALELLGLEWKLRESIPFLRTHAISKITLVSDNAASIILLKKLGWNMSNEERKIVRRIRDIGKHNNLTLTPVWRRRNHALMRRADKLSKIFPDNTPAFTSKMSNLVAEHFGTPGYAASDVKITLAAGHNNLVDTIKVAQPNQLVILPFSEDLARSVLRQCTVVGHGSL